MKRYYLFVWATYYPDGGMNDFKMSSNEIRELKACLKKTIEEEGEDYLNWQVFDFKEEKVVASRVTDLGGSKEIVGSLD